MSTQDPQKSERRFAVLIFVVGQRVPRTRNALGRVSVIRIADTILTVNGLCTPSARETAEDKLARIIKAEAEMA